MPPLPPAIALPAQSIAQVRRREDLESDLALRRTLQRIVEIVGAAAKGVSDATRGRAPTVPWREIAACGTS